MTDLQKYVTQRLESFRDRTALYGSLEAVESLAMQLIEIEAHLAGLDRENPRIVIDTWIRDLHRLQKLQYVIDNVQPLHRFIPEGDPENNKFGPALYELAQRVRRKLRLLPKEPVSTEA